MAKSKTIVTLENNLKRASRSNETLTLFT
jgi:hypothetical protein